MTNKQLEKGVIYAKKIEDIKRYVWALKRGKKPGIIPKIEIEGLCWDVPYECRETVLDILIEKYESDRKLVAQKLAEL